MGLTKHALEAIGYKEYPDTDVKSVSFGILRAYSIIGITFEQACEQKISKAISLSEHCKIAIAQSINEASKLLTGDVFTDEDEAKWLSDKKTFPPFLLIYFRESVSRELRGGYRLEKDGYIHTYDAFPEGKKEIREWEAEALPGIISAITVKLSTLERQATLTPIERSIFGTTEDGSTLFDMKVTGSASISVSTRKTLDEINSSLEDTKILLPILTKDISRNFYSALNEPDLMKQFLGYFQFIERFTHSTFKTLNYKADISPLFNIPDRVGELTAHFFEDIFSKSNNLSQRFHWCSMVAWKNIDDDDIRCFLELKKIRDKLSHGEHIEDVNLPVLNTKTLALKLLGVV